MMFKSSFRNNLFVALISQPAVSVIESCSEILGEATAVVFSCASNFESIVLFRRRKKSDEDEAEANSSGIDLTSMRPVLSFTAASLESEATLYRRQCCISEGLPFAV